MAAHRPTPSLVDVARAAQVSTATAGRALGSYGHVSEAARDRVMAAAAALGYRSNSLARGMVTGTTHTVGVVVTDVANPFFAAVLRGISDVTDPAGFQVLLANTNGDLQSEQRALKVMSEQRVDGVILAAARPSKGDHVKQLVAAGVPLVLVDRLVTGVHGADSVAIDNELAARQAVQHLLDLGHKRIGLVTESSRSGEDPLARSARRRKLMPSAQRQLGYLQTLDHAGIEYDPELVALADYDRASAHLATGRLLELQDRPTAVLCTDNVLASGALRAIQERDLRIPDDVSLIGFDDEAWTTLVRPGITVVEQPNYDLGVQAGKQLLGRLQGPTTTSPQNTRLLARLVVRGSTGSPPSS